MQDVHVQWILGSPWQKQQPKAKLDFKEETSKVLPLEYSFVWCWNMDTSKRRSEVPWKFWNVMLEKAVEDQLEMKYEYFM